MLYRVGVEQTVRGDPTKPLSGLVGSPLLEVACDSVALSPVGVLGVRLITPPWGVSGTTKFCVIVFSISSPCGMPAVGVVSSPLKIFSDTPGCVVGGLTSPCAGGSLG